MIQNIIFDFDGVILDSVPIRTDAFRELFSEYRLHQVNKLIDFHSKNGGISRFKKIDYFYKNVLKVEVSEAVKDEKARSFSNIVTSKLLNPKLLMPDVIYFIEKNYLNFNMHIVSASENNELNYICNNLNISKYFSSILGSPTIKEDNIKNLIDTHQYNTSETIMIGDSINDYDAAKCNNIMFYGYNNEKLNDHKKNYIKSFYNFNII